MKKTKKTALMAAILSGAAVLGGCDHGSDNVQDVYGPPVTEAATVVTEPMQTEYGAPEAEEVTSSAATTAAYDPSKDIVEEIYGPPVTENKDIEEETKPYAPEEDKIQLVYGPPESFGQ